MERRRPGPTPEQLVRGQEVREANTIRRAIQLSLVPELAPIPNAALRTSLFRIARRGTKHLQLDGVELASWHPDLSVTYKGPELRQEDLTMYAFLCKLACVGQAGAAHPEPGEDRDFVARFTARTLLAEMQKTDGSKNYKWLKESLDRLYEASVHAKYEGKGRGGWFKGRLVREVAYDKDTRTYEVSLSERIAALFGLVDMTMLDMPIRMALTTDVARWLHAFLASHKGPEIMIPWDKLQALVGSETSPEAFRRNFVSRAVKPLIQEGVVASYKNLEEGLLLLFKKGE